LLPKYLPVIQSFSPGVARALQIKLNLDANLPLWDALVLKHLGQADVVLELLHLSLLPEVEALIGHPIQKLPPRPPKPYPLLPRRKPSPDDRRIISVVQNPRLPTTPSFYRYQYFIPGQTLGSALRRGATRRDIREAFKNNWVTVAEMRI
jgi:hypothetical protein